MVRPIDQEMTAIEKTVCDSQFPRGGGTPRHGRPHREAPGSVRRLREQRKNTHSSLYCGFPGKEQERQGKPV